jgi:hypothetical protein
MKKTKCTQCENYSNSNEMCQVQLIITDKKNKKRYQIITEVCVECADIDELLNDKKINSHIHEIDYNARSIQL